MGSRLEAWDGTTYQPVTTGVPGPRTLAQVSVTTPTARGTGDMWVNPNDVMLAWDTDWKYPTLLNGWVNAWVGGHEAAKYRKMASGLVVISGLVTNGPAGSAVFVLPTGYRPGPGVLLLNTWANGQYCRFNIEPGGAVLHAAGPNGDVSLEFVFWAA